MEELDDALPKEVCSIQIHSMLLFTARSRSLAVYRSLRAVEQDQVQDQVP